MVRSVVIEKSDDPGEWIACLGVVNVHACLLNQPCQLPSESTGAKDHDIGHATSLPRVNIVFGDIVRH